MLAQKKSGSVSKNKYPPPASSSEIIIVTMMNLTKELLVFNGFVNLIHDRPEGKKTKRKHESRKF
jgi:hypothetical protein